MVFEKGEAAYDDFDGGAGAAILRRAISYEFVNICEFQLTMRLVQRARFLVLGLGRIVAGGFHLARDPRLACAHTSWLAATCSSKH